MCLSFLGDEQRCANEGEQVVGDSIKFITDVDPCIKCFCRVSINNVSP